MKKYAVIGLARTGLSTFNFLKMKGFEVIGIDTMTDPTKQASILSQLMTENVIFGNKYETLDFSDIISVMSPGVPESSSLYQKIISDNGDIISDLDLFNEFNTKPTLAITGTNGKTTSVEMLHHILTTSGISSKIGANHGTGALDLLESDHEINILELSSFQLQLVKRLSLLAAAILNISSNHIDRHLTLENYIFAKKKIFHNSKFSIIDRDNELTHPSVAMPTRIAIGENNPSGLGYQQRGSEIIITSDGKSMASSRELGLCGLHNVKNFLVSASLAQLVGVDMGQSCKAIVSFAVSPNRLEYVAENYINDSKSTTIASTIAGIESIAKEKKIILMLGGDSKNADISAIIPILPRISHIVCFGRDGRRFYDVCSPLTPSTLEEDIGVAIKLAIDITKESKGVLLFSPAGTSLDRFSSYDERGKFFKEMVSKYA